MTGKEYKKNFSFTAGLDDSGKRLDIFLASMIPYKSRNYLQKLIESGIVLVNNNPVEKNYKLVHGDQIRITDIDFLEPDLNIKPQDIKLKIRYEDDYLVIISKDPYMSVHPAAGNYENTIANALLFYFKRNVKDFSDASRPGIVHRLDKNTSGLLIAAKNDSIQAKVSELFRERKVSKVYKSLVLGNFNEKNGTIILPVARSRLDRRKITVSADSGKKSETRFTVVESFKNCTLVDVFPVTGRTHQIRVHFNYIGHPVIGDSVYGNSETERIARAISLERQFLHACKLAFLHPVTGLKIEVEDDLSEDLKKSLEFLRKNKI